MFDRLARLRSDRLAGASAIRARLAALVGGFALLAMLRLRLLFDHLIDIAPLAVFAAIAVHRLLPSVAPSTDGAGEVSHCDEGFT
jgi:hypothetical protein